ncbi:hypothetical protein E4U19_005637 [Claviceps sp. Clav32 group G5]|nr:hypothetical protein E4U19_005637 [Claviceps sp. Clav32 group G5]
MSTSSVSSGTASSSLITTLVSTTLAKTSAAAATASVHAAFTSTTFGDSSLSSHDEANQPLVSNYRDPFYASTFPVCYALAATTVTAYMLLIMLFMTPRSFLDGGVVYLGRRSGFTHSSSGGENIGGRPWLQKVAALTVAVSLTIATYDTFKLAALQYSYGVQNAASMQSEVMGSMELRVTRLVSNFFLWLAQAQTLIRLFPRHREKVIIKWVAFCLITLDLIFSAINSFKTGESGTTGLNPAAGSFDHPIPALSYMFQLLLGVLYAAWVIYYSLMKKRYAFYHPLMRNMCVLAMISLTSILIPVVFFILDISRPKFAGWGDYVRWVGAAAASVIVWEWVERIEALEREEKKGGILGREVLDGDDAVLEVSALDYPWDRKRGHRRHGNNGSNNGDSNRNMRNNRNIRSRRNMRNMRHIRNTRNIRSGRNRGDDTDALGSVASHRDRVDDAHSYVWPVASGLRSCQRGHHKNAAQDEMTEELPPQRSMAGLFRPPWPVRPSTDLGSLSRPDTPSAASTVYAIRYPPCSEMTARTPEPLTRTSESPSSPSSAPAPAPAPAAAAAAPLSSSSSSSSASAAARHIQSHSQQLRQRQPQRPPQSPQPPIPSSSYLPQQRRNSSAVDGWSHDAQLPQTSHVHTDSALPGQHEHHTSPRRTTTSIGRPSNPNSMVDVEASTHAPAPTRVRHWQDLMQTSSSRPSPDAPQPTATTDTAGAQDANAGTDTRDVSASSRWDIKTRLEMFAATQADRMREKLRPTTDTDSLPVTYIPAPARHDTAPGDVAEDEDGDDDDDDDNNNDNEDNDDEVPRCSTAYDSDAGSDQVRRREQQQQQDIGLGIGIGVGPGREEALSGQQSHALSPMLPPLWPGVRRHTLSYPDGDDEDDEDESSTGGSADEFSFGEGVEESRRGYSEDDPRSLGSMATESQG